MVYIYKEKEYYPILLDDCLVYLNDREIELLKYFHMQDLEVVDKLPELCVQYNDEGSKIIIERGYNEKIFNYNEETQDVVQIPLILVTYIKGNIRHVSLFREILEGESYDGRVISMESKGDTLKFDIDNLNDLKFIVDDFYMEKLLLLQEEKKEFDNLIDGLIKNPTNILHLTEGISKRSDGKFKKRSKVDLWETEEALQLINNEFGKKVFDGLTLKLRAIDNDELRLELGNKQVDTVINARWKK